MTEELTILRPAEDPFDGCICPRTHKAITLYGPYLRCLKPCSYLVSRKTNPDQWCPWGEKGVERRREAERDSVEFMCGKGGCQVKPKGLLWEDVDRMNEGIPEVVECPDCGREFRP